MKPFEVAVKAVPLIERGGVVAAVIICCAVIIFVMSLAIVVLWRGRESCILEIQQLQKAHYEQMLAIDNRNTKLNHEIADTLASHLEMMRSLCEKMAVVLDRVGRD